MAFDYFSASIPSAGASSHSTASSQPPKRPNGFDYYCVCAVCMCVPGLARYNIHGVIKYFSFSYFVIKTFSALNRAPMKSAADTPLRFVFKRAREIIIKKGIIIIIIQLIYIAEIFILKFIFIFIFSAHGLFWQIILK
jgi:hypothetical protein